MGYVYDILINLNKELIEYFEWEESDNIKYVKKIIVFKTNKDLINDIVKNNIVFDSSFTDIIPKYEINDMKTSNKICLLTDGLIAIAVLIDNNKPVLFSRLLLDEEYEVLEMASHLENYKINYKNISTKSKKIKYLTRNERKIEKELREKLKNLY